MLISSGSSRLGVCLMGSVGPVSAMLPGHGHGEDWKGGHGRLQCNVMMDSVLSGLRQWNRKVCGLHEFMNSLPLSALHNLSLR